MVYLLMPSLSSTKWSIWFSPLDRQWQVFSFHCFFHSFLHTLFSISPFQRVFLSNELLLTKSHFLLQLYLFPGQFSIPTSLAFLWTFPSSFNFPMTWRIFLALLHILCISFFLLLVILISLQNGNNQTLHLLHLHECLENCVSHISFIPQFINPRAGSVQILFGGLHIALKDKEGLTFWQHTLYVMDGHWLVKCLSNSKDLLL